MSLSSLPTVEKFFETLYELCDTSFFGEDTLHKLLRWEVLQPFWSTWILDI